MKSRCDYTIHGHLEQSLVPCQVSLIMAHFLAEIGVGDRGALIFVCTGKQLSIAHLAHRHILPCKSLQSLRGDQGSPPKPRRIDFIRWQNLTISGAALPPYSWAGAPTSHQSPTLYLWTHLLTLWDAHTWDNTRYICLNHGYASERRNSTLETSFNVDSPSNRNFSSILKKTWSVDYIYLLILPGSDSWYNLGSSILVAHLHRKAQNHTVQATTSVLLVTSGKSCLLLFCIQKWCREVSWVDVALP